VPRNVNWKDVIFRKLVFLRYKLKRPS